MDHMPLPEKKIARRYKDPVLKIAKRILSGKLVNERVLNVNFVAQDLMSEHFTSTVTILRVSVQDNSDPHDKRTIELIAKVLDDRGNAYLELAFRKESEFYSCLLPVYNNIGLSCNIHASIAPDYFGSNISSTKDKKGIILLENLNSSKYMVYSGELLNWDHTKLTIERISYFHALGIALKKQNPKAFEENFKNLVEPALVNSHLVDRSSVNMQLRTEIKNLLQKRPEVEMFTSSVDKLLEKIDNMRIPQPKEPFSTLIHNDLWKNNILFHYYPHQQRDNMFPIDLKFIDFQFVLYNSPIRDLAYFIFSSCSLEIQKDFRKVSMFYYESLLNNLEKLRCDTSEFTRSRFIEEVNEYAPTKLKHLILLFRKNPEQFEEKFINLVLCLAECDLLENK